MGKSFPSTSILGVGFGTILDLALIFSTVEGGGGADKLVTDAGNIEGGGEDADLVALVVIFESRSFDFVPVDGEDPIPGDSFVGVAVVEILTCVGIVAGVEDITLFKGGALHALCLPPCSSIIKSLSIFHLALPV